MRDWRHLVGIGDSDKTPMSNQTDLVGVVGNSRTKPGLADRATRAWKYSVSAARMPTTWVLIALLVIVLLSDLDIKSGGVIYDMWKWVRGEILGEWLIASIALGVVMGRYLLPPYDPPRS